MKRNSNLICSILVIALLVISDCSAFARAVGTAAPQDFAAKVDEYMQAQTKLRRFSGSILVAREGKVLVAKGYGFANAEWDIPNTPQTKFRLGSITKQFTSMAVMQLHERGRLSVQDPICKYFDPCPASWKTVTIHHLLTHTSGIPSYTGLPDYRRKMMIPTTTEDMVARFRDLPLEFQPGERYKYDNSGYFLLGMIIEKVTSRSYEEVLRSQIFEPLGMKDTGYDHSETIIKMRASGYAPGGDHLVNAPVLDMAQPYSAGSLYSTVEDLLVWDQSLYTEKLLPKKAMDAMFTVFKGDYAYGWMVRSASAATFNRRQIGHGGGINGFSTFIARYPDDNATVIVLCNNQGFPAQRVATDLSAILFGERYELPVERKAVTVDPALYDSYTGQYQLTPSMILTVTREAGRLMTQATGQGKIEMFPESETKFFNEAIDAEITFVKDDKGRVTELVLRQGGGERRALRLK